MPDAGSIRSVDAGSDGEQVDDGGLRQEDNNGVDSGLITDAGIAATEPFLPSKRIFTPLDRHVTECVLSIFWQHRV